MGEPQFNHVIVARDYKTLKPRVFQFLTRGDEYLLVKEINMDKCSQCESTENLRQIGDALVCDVCEQKSLEILDRTEQLD